MPCMRSPKSSSLPRSQERTAFYLTFVDQLEELVPTRPARVCDRPERHLPLIPVLLRVGHRQPARRVRLVDLDDLALAGITGLQVSEPETERQEVTLATEGDLVVHADPDH